MDNDNLATLLENKKKNVRVENLAISIGEINSMYRDGELILRPEYQRLLKWDKRQKTLFIESLLLGLPTPSIFVSVDKLGKWEIVDGLQRLSTVFDFIAQLKPDDTRFIPQYSPFRELSDDLVYLTNDKQTGETFIGKKFEDFPQKVQLEFKRQRVNVVILLSGTSDDVKYELFQRVNEGGTPITPMEFRRAILCYQNEETLKEINSICEDALFTDFLDESFEKDKSFKAQATVLYFLTLYRKSTEITAKEVNILNVDAFITKYVREFNQQNVLADLEIFKQVLQKLKSLSFQKPNKIFTGNNRYSDTVFGTITLGIAFNLQNLPDDVILKEKIEKLVDEPEFKKYYQRGFSASARIPNMLKFCREYFAKNEE